MSRFDGTANGSAAGESQTTDESSGVGRRSVLGGIAGAAGAPVVAGTALSGDGVLGSAAAAELDPTLEWESSPTEGEIAALRSREGSLVAQTAASVVSLEQSTGSALWSYDTRTQAPSLTLHDGGVYIVDGQTVLALDDSGSERWSVSYDSGARLQVRDDEGFVSGGSTLQALSLADGSTIWTTESETLEEVRRVTESLVLTVEGGSGSEVVAAYDRSDGSEVWRTEVATNVSLTSTSFGLERVYYGYGSTLDAISVADGSVVWSREFDQSGLPFVFEVRGTAYLFREGKIAELSDEDGSEVWSLETDGFPFPNDFIGGGPDALEDVEAVVVATRNTVQVVGLDGTRRWSYETRDTQNFSRAAAVGGTVYATDADTLVELEGGEETWTYSNDGTTLGSAATDSRRVYTNDTATVYGFQHGIEGVDGTTSTTTAPGGEQTTAAPGGEQTTAAPEDTTAPSGETTVPTTESATTAAGGSGGTDTMSDGGDGGDDGDDGDDGGGGSPGFGVVATLVAGLLAAARLLGGDDGDGDD